MASRVRVKGLSALRNDVRMMPQEVEEGARKGVEEVVIDLASEIAADAPVDTGALRDSVEAVGDTVIIGEGYAEFVEDDQPFIRPNVDAVLRSASKTIAVAIDKEIG